MKFLFISFFLFSLIQCASDKKEDSATKPDAEASLEANKGDFAEPKEAEQVEEEKEESPTPVKEITETEVPQVPKKQAQVIASPPTSTEDTTANETRANVTREDLKPKETDKEDDTLSSILSDVETDVPEASTIALADLSEQDQKVISSVFSEDEKACKETSRSLSTPFGKHRFYLTNILKEYQTFVTYFSFYKNLAFFPKNSVYLEAKYKLAGKRLKKLSPQKASKVVEAYLQEDQDQKNRLKQMRENSLDRLEFLDQVNELSLKPVLVCMSLFESNWPNFKVLTEYQKKAEDKAYKHSEFLTNAFENSYQIGVLDAIEKVSYYLLVAYAGQQYEALRHVEVQKFMKSLNHNSPYFNFSAQSLVEELSTYSFKELLAEVPKRKAKLMVQSQKYRSITKNLALAFSTAFSYPWNLFSSEDVSEEASE